jgi:hypothetical protein
MAAREVGAVATLVVCVIAGTSTVESTGQEVLTVFLNLPVANGFTDATHALVEAREIVSEPLARITDLRLVDHPEGADVVLTVLGRGKGDVELTAALRSLSSTILAPPVPIGATERYIEIMLTTGACRTMSITAAQDSPESCYRRIFVGVGFSELDSRRSTKKPALNSWEACAEAIARDVRAWMTTNADRVRALRAPASR